MQPNNLSLPPELWFHIVSLTRREDLPSLCLVSPSLLNPSRPALYHHLIIDATSGSAPQSLGATFTLLQADGGALAKEVKKLEIVGPNDSRVRLINNTADQALKELIPLKVIACMTNLHALCIRFLSHYSSRFGPEFAALLTEYCQLLKEVELEHVDLQLPLNLRGIERIKYSSNGACSCEISAFSNSHVFRNPYSRMPPIAYRILGQHIDSSRHLHPGVGSNN